MIVKVCNADYSLQWDGIYQFALENYPHIQEWELEKLAKFIAYEQDHCRTTINLVGSILDQSCKIIQCDWELL